MPPSLTMPKPGRWRTTPPAIFPPIMGLFGLGLGWRNGAGAFGIGPGLSDIILGAVTLLYLFSLFAYGAKVAKRAGVVADDLKVLPGRAGLAALTQSGLLLAITALAYRQGLAQGVLWVALAGHTVLALLAIRWLMQAAPEARGVTPVWHLSFVGFIIAPLSAIPLGYVALSTAIFWATLAIALFVWGASAAQAMRARVPAPLRPLLAIHLAPAALFTMVAAGLGMPTMALAFGLISAVMAAAMVLGARWLTAAGFSPLWGAFTFPLAAFSNACFALWHEGQGEGWRIAGGLALVAATLIVPVIAVKVLQLWAKGQLAPKTNAATA